jgi:hypothetical protein
MVKFSEKLRDTGGEALTVTSKRNIPIQNVFCYLSGGLKHAANKCPNVVIKLLFNLILILILF